MSTITVHVLVILLSVIIIIIIIIIIIYLKDICFGLNLSLV